MSKEQQWDWEISPSTTWWGNSFKELAAYKDLLFRLVRKDFLSSYQQTLLGPFWVIFQPLLTVIIYILVFNQIMGLSTGKVPAFLFYLAGVILWNFFSELFQGIAHTFSQHANIFEKVYFPRLIAPLSILLMHSVRFGIQLVFFLAMLFFYYTTGKLAFNPGLFFWFIPVIIATAGMGLGAGLIFSVVTAKYKDLFGLINVLIRVLLFLCPVFYSLSIVPEKLKWLVNANPMSAQFELFRYAFFGTGQVSMIQVIYSVVFMLVVMLTGWALFNKMNEKIIDVV